jgi:hypothetical protein
MLQGKIFKNLDGLLNKQSIGIDNSRRPAMYSFKPLNELLQYYAMERFLYRLSLSVHAERFILKGALMLRIWRAPGFRPTMDIDMLGITSNKEAEIIRQIQDILIEDVEPDGLDFDPDSIQL